MYKISFQACIVMTMIISGVFGEVVNQSLEIAECVQSCFLDLHSTKKNEPKDTDPVEPPKIGNFSLPSSQQPAPLFGFGGNVINQGKIQLFLFADYFQGKDRIISDVIPNVLFGVTDDFSISFNFPFTPRMQSEHDLSNGFEDFFCS